MPYPSREPWLPQSPSARRKATVTHHSETENPWPHLSFQQPTGWGWRPQPPPPPRQSATTPTPVSGTAVTIQYLSRSWFNRGTEERCCLFSCFLHTYFQSGSCSLLLPETGGCHLTHLWPPPHSPGADAELQVASLKWHPSHGARSSRLSLSQKSRDPVVGRLLGSGQLLTFVLGPAPGQPDDLENVANSL